MVSIIGFVNYKDVCTEIKKKKKSKAKNRNTATAGELLLHNCFNFHLLIMF